MHRLHLSTPPLSQQPRLAMACLMVGGRHHQQLKPHISHLSSVGGACVHSFNDFDFGLSWIGYFFLRTTGRRQDILFANYSSKGPRQDIYTFDLHLDCTFARYSRQIPQQSSTPTDEETKFEPIDKRTLRNRRKKQGH